MIMNTPPLTAPGELNLFHGRDAIIMCVVERRSVIEPSSLAILVGVRRSQFRLKVTCQGPKVDIDFDTA